MIKIIILLPLLFGCFGIINQNDSKMTLTKMQLPQYGDNEKLIKILLYNTSTSSTFPILKDGIHRGGVDALTKYIQIFRERKVIDHISVNIGDRYSNKSEIDKKIIKISHIASPTIEIGTGNDLTYLLQNEITPETPLTISNIHKIGGNAPELLQSTATQEISGINFAVISVLANEKYPNRDKEYYRQYIIDKTVSSIVKAKNSLKNAQFIILNISIESRCFLTKSGPTCPKNDPFLEIIRRIPNQYFNLITTTSLENSKVSVADFKNTKLIQLSPDGDEINLTTASFNNNSKVFNEYKNYPQTVKLCYRFYKQTNDCIGPVKKSMKHHFIKAKFLGKKIDLSTN